MKDVVKCRDAQSLVGKRIMAETIITSVRPSTDPAKQDAYEVVGIDTTGEQRIPIGTRSRATAHNAGGKWVQVRVVNYAPEASALRFRASVENGTRRNVAGNISSADIEDGEVKVITLYLDDVAD